MKCRPGIVCLILLYVSTAGYSAEPRREAVHRRADQEGIGEGEPEWKDELRRKLETKVEFEFVRRPLTDCIAHLQKLGQVNIIIDPGAIEEVGDVPITLRVTNMPLRLALDWVLRLAGMGFDLVNEVVYVSTPDRLPYNLEVRLYDVRDLILPQMDQKALLFDTTGRFYRRRYEGYGQEQVLSAARLAEMIRERVCPEKWYEDLGTGIETQGGGLVIRQWPEVHEKVAAFLDSLCQGFSVHIRVNVRILSVPETLLAEFSDKPGHVNVVYLKEGELARIEKGAAGGVHELDTLQVTCLCGTIGQAVLGKSAVAPAEGAPTGGFRGTMLTVLPFASHDRRYVTMQLALVRAGRRPDEAAPLFQVAATVRCLESDTVLFAGVKDNGEDTQRRIIALVTPVFLRLEPSLRKRKPVAEVEF